MKVNLIKEAVYELNEKKSSQVPFDAFVKMSGVDINNKHDDDLPRVRIFESIDEFKQTENYDQYDTTKDVFILKSGQFCVFLKHKEDDVVNITEENVATDTKENTGEEA